MDTDRHRGRKDEEPAGPTPPPVHRCSSVFIRGGAAGLLLLALAGCRSAPPRPVMPPPPVLTGEIVRVNEAERLVVGYAAHLPEAGQEATVFSKEGEVGRIRFTSASRPPYRTAEILEGRPRRGDHFRVDPVGAKNRSTP